MRSCAYCIEALNGCIDSDNQEITVELLVGEMNCAVEDLQNDLKSLSGLFNPEDETPENNKTAASIPLMGVISVATFASLLIELASRVEAVAEEVEELANLAEFEVLSQYKFKQNPASTKVGPADEQNDQDTIKSLEKV